MYEDMTFERIMKRMLDRVPDTLDKRESGIIYTALAPAAVELQNAYIEMDWILNQSFADTQDREYLIRRCAERGITPEPATYALLKGEFNIDIPIGSRFSLGMLNYTAAHRIEAGVYQMQCETAGEEGNRYFGSLIPINYIQGLTSAKLTEILIPGEDEEGTEHLRQRYFDSLDARAFGGNIQDYKEKLDALDGVGGCKIYPTWNGGGTVKAVIINSSFDKPSQELINKVQNATDPEDHQGQGIGFAPIGHVVTIEAVEETEINVSTVLTYKEGWGWEETAPYIEEAIEGYLKELRASWADTDGLIVRISQIETRLLDIVGVLDITGTTINGEEKNFVLGVNDIPIKGEIHGT